MDTGKLREPFITTGGLDVEPERGFAFFEIARDYRFCGDLQKADPEVGIGFGSCSDRVVEVGG